MSWYPRLKEDEAWEHEVPELTEKQRRVQAEILKELGRDRRKKDVGTNYIDTSYSVGARVRHSIRWELDSSAFGDITDSGDS